MNEESAASAGVGAAPQTTKEKILEMSLRLFNERGERNVTTNHIAAELEISPGNLYYHYRNKEAIIHEIFHRFEAFMESRLVVLPEHLERPETMPNYMSAAFHCMWEYRFLLRDLPHILSRNERLKEQYEAFVHRNLKRVESVYLALKQVGMIEAGDEDIRSITMNSWLIVTYWLPFQTSLGNEDSSLAAARGGVLQIMALWRPYVTERYLPIVRELEEKYR